MHKLAYWGVKIKSLNEPHDQIEIVTRCADERTLAEEDEPERRGMYASGSSNYTMQIRYNCKVIDDFLIWYKTAKQ